MCVNYNYNLIDLVFPSKHIYQELCSSYDKTKLFLMSTIRLILYIILHYYIVDLNLSNKMKQPVHVISYVLITISCIILLISIRKQQKFPKIDIIKKEKCKKN
jgi:hypothetical protein